MPQDPWNDNHRFGTHREPTWEQTDEHGNVIADSNWPNGFPDAECDECGEPFLTPEDNPNQSVCPDCEEEQ